MPDATPNERGVPVIAMDRRYSCGRQFFAAPFYATDVPTHIARPVALDALREDVIAAAVRFGSCEYGQRTEWEVVLLKAVSAYVGDDQVDDEPEPRDHADEPDSRHEWEC
jgi:hypothetical protein